MLKVYKNIFYANATAFKEVYPDEPIQDGLTQQFLLNKPNKGKIDQVRIGADVLDDQLNVVNGIKPDVNITLRTFNEPKTSTINLKSETETIWITFRLPNQRHIDWIFTPNHLKWEYYIEGYGYTGYLFAEIHQGQSDDKLIVKEYNIGTGNELWVYDSTSNRKKQKSQIITHEVPEMVLIFDLVSQVFTICNNLKINYETSPQHIYDDMIATDPNVVNLISKLIDQMSNFDLHKSPLFKIIHEIQCYIHDVENMFKVDKLWDKKANQSAKKDSIKVSHIKKQ